MPHASQEPGDDRDDPAPARFLRGVFETHLEVAELGRAMAFYETVLGLERGVVERDRKLVLYWVGGRGRAMLGLWEKPAAEIRRQHFAFAVALADLDRVASSLRARGVALRDFFDRPASAPTVFGWMPAASYYFDDPDGHLLEVLATLPGEARPELGVVDLDTWRRGVAAPRMPDAGASPVEIRAATGADWPEIWRLFRQVVEAGDAFAYDEATSDETARSLWLGAGAHAFVALDEPRGERIVGTYYVRPNQPGHGAHVANAGYMVDAAARGRGISGALCEHSLAVARSLGFEAMQFNFVVSTNEAAVRAWQRHGFAVVGRLPGAFRHARLGDVDALVMYREL
jgi:L-amino acid N-acyltransferase YncA/predicted enzyme related to lactoylglutathione lyase